MKEKDIAKKIYFNKYKIKKLIIKTSCCFLYEGINIKNKEPVAMKFEKIKGKYNLLESETYYLIYLKGFGIPKIITYGKNNYFNILIQELLGLSIHQIWKINKIVTKKELLKNICMIALQCIDRLEYIHSKNIIHRDIKPHNFLVGRKDPKNIYLIDFGFAHKYRSSRTGKHIKFRITNYICGSLRFISFNGNRGYELSRRDDLESLAYMLISLSNNSLPWNNLNPKENHIILINKIFKLKKETTPEMLCKGLPNEFVEFLKYCKKLDFEGNPDYKYLKGLFTSVLSKNELINDFLFFWVKKNKKNEIEENIEERSNNFTKRKNSSQKRLYNQIKKSLEKSKSQERNKSYIKDEVNSYNYKIMKSSDLQIIKNNYIKTPDKNINKNNIFRPSGTSSITNVNFENREDNLSYIDNFNYFANNFYSSDEAKIFGNNSPVNDKNKINYKDNICYNNIIKIKKNSISNKAPNFNNTIIKNNNIYKTLYEREELKKKNNNISYNNELYFNKFNNNNYSSNSINKKYTNTQNPKIIKIDNKNIMMKNQSHKILKINNQKLYNDNNYNIINNSFLIFNKNVKLTSPNSIQNIIAPNSKIKKIYIKEIPSNFKDNKSKNKIMRIIKHKNYNLNDININKTNNKYFLTNSYNNNAYMNMDNFTKRLKINNSYEN